jgi:hypothetical protein
LIGEYDYKNMSEDIMIGNNFAISYGTIYVLSKCSIDVSCHHFRKRSSSLCYSYSV